jgi:hypothetical protein
MKEAAGELRRLLPCLLVRLLRQSFNIHKYLEAAGLLNTKGQPDVDGSCASHALCKTETF